MNDRARRLGLTCFVLLAVGTVRSAEEPAKTPDVPVARPVVREVTDYEDFTGRTEASRSVELRPRVTGYLTKTSFKEGDRVKDGDVLFEIDPRLCRAQLDQALARVARSTAALKRVRAALARDRAAAKAVPGSISQEQLDEREGAVQEAEADVTVSEANVTLHKLNLSFCKVAAPVSGRIGRCLVDPGNLVQQDQTQLATIVVSSPIYVSFDIDERTFIRLWRAIKRDKVERDTFPVAVGLADEEGFPRSGVTDFTANTIDLDTGTLRVRATLANTDGLLVPGMFVRVRLAMGAPYKAPLVSDRAIASDQGLKFVYVVDAENKVQYRRVALGQLQSDGLRAITKGLEPDDRVVTGRLTGLRPGMTVRPREAAAPVPKLPEKTDEPPSVRGQAGPGILVEATYPGASARVVSDSVRWPIEQQVAGLEKIRSLRSRCARDGKYALDINFVPGTDLGQAQVLVQNRASLASPLLPTAVQEAGITVGTGTAGVLLIVNLVSPREEHKQPYLGHYAHIQLKDELARVRGVGKVALLGTSDLGLRIQIDPDRLAALNLNTEDVARVLRKENRLELADSEKLGNLIVKADGERRGVRVRDVARVELGAGRPQSEALWDGKPVATLVVHLTGEIAPRRVRAALQERLDDLRLRLPKGLDLDVTFDFTANLDAFERPASAEYLVFDLDVPAASTEGTEQVLERSEALLRRVPGVRSVLALSANPFDLFGGRPCLLARLSPADARKATRAEIIKAARTRLGALEEVTVRVRDLSAGGFPRCGYPIDLVLNGPDLVEVQNWADQLTERLRQSKAFTDVWANPDSVPRPGRLVDVNRELAAARGVALADVFSTIDAYSGAVPVNHFNSFGRMWPVEIRTQARSGDWAAGLGKLKVRNAKGLMVPLASVVRVREVEEPLALDFFELRPTVEITANPESGVTVAAAQKACTALADEVRKELGLSGDYRLTWLTGGASGK
ncbi:efflux RND transporter permease subunit [Frigoriglobus tundricola]|uniref:Uncharacterized protein n=1 Tax=Frigoriglobus tundricola TaxID=2774151 RepID=A0A6M5YV39_9BACT|nr:efflux RND transporter permease subunit [Frigoriglobus tundricola]QJW97324.1 hypothetical protein FTUN_4894 [Frigoriglobus tundricola]